MNNKINKGLTLTIISDISANYGESIGNIGSVQTVYRNGNIYAIRSMQSMKNAIMTQAGMYDNMNVVVNSVAQKDVDEKEKSVATIPGLEGGYLTTNGSKKKKSKKDEEETEDDSESTKDKKTYSRCSSISVSDAIDFEPYNTSVGRFHTNISLSKKAADQKGVNLQEHSKECGQMIYQYDYSKAWKKYSVTIDLDMIGTDGVNMASREERIARVVKMLRAIQSLNLVVHGSRDNAEPIFIVGGIGEDGKRPFFDNVVSVDGNNLIVNNSLKYKLSKGYSCGFIDSKLFSNQDEIEEELNPISVEEFFDNLCEEVEKIY